VTVDSSVADAAVDVRALVPAQRPAQDAVLAPPAQDAVVAPRAEGGADLLGAAHRGADPVDDLERSWADEPRRRELPVTARRTAGTEARAATHVEPPPVEARSVEASLVEAPPVEAPSVEASLVEAPAAATPRRTGRWVDHLLTVGALLGLLMTGVTIAATVTGLRPLVVKSGSMEPTIATGGMVLTREVTAAEIAVGDVVAVTRPDRTRVTHRVVEVTHKGATAELVLKGDANEDVDPVPVTVTSAGEVVYSAPWLGRVSAFLTSAAGGFSLGCVVTAVLMVVLRRRP
jgi:signal peptidase I